jgi:3-oxoacyl-[acyl-carrier-protein] synthase II
MEGFGCGVDLGAAPITLLADGSGLLRGMSMALEDGGRSPADVHYINAHAPGTPLIDGLECRAIRNLLPPASATLPSVNSTKSLTSHMSAASAVVDVVATLLQMRDGFIHPHAGLDDPDPELAIPVVGAETIERSVTIALSNACGGGGLNTSVLITAPRTAPRTVPCSPATASQSAAYTGAIVMTGLGGITPWWSGNHAACSQAHDGAAPGRLEALDITRWYPSSTGYSYMNRAGQLGAIAGYLAIDGTCIQKRYAPDRVAVLSGTLLGGAPEGSAVMNEALTQAPETIRPSMALDHGVHLSTALVRRYFDFNGFTYTFTGSCAGGLQATAVAADLLRTRRADAVVVIGHDALDAPLQRAAPWLADCLPADRLTEGGAAVVFERDEEGRGHAMMPAAALAGTMLLTTEAGASNAPADQDDAALDAMADRLIAGLPGLTWDTVYLAGPRRNTLDRLAARLVDRQTRHTRRTRQAAASHANGGEAYGMAADAMICLVSAAARRERALVLALDPFGVLAAAVVAPAA